MPMAASTMSQMHRAMALQDQTGNAETLAAVLLGHADDAEDEAGNGQQADVGPAKDQAKQTADEAGDAAAVRTALSGTGAAT